MYTTAVPIAINSMSDTEFEKDLQKYLDYFKRGNINRVFIAVLPGVYTRAFWNDITSEKFKRTVEFFKENGLETGVWISGFGHGSTLTHNSENEFRGSYQKIVGVLGESYEHGYCPTDENFIADYAASVKQIASLSPDLIMFDDDYRLNNRRYYFGCFCEKHLAEYRRILGEDVRREDIAKLVFTGGRNKYRDAYMDMSHDTLLNFAKTMRNAVDEINPDIRIGLCTSPSLADLDGADLIELVNVLAGKNKPFIRPFGAPYLNQYDITYPLESSRMTINYIRNNDSNIEIFAEGDVYPRPRYNVSSKCLELFELVLCCEGNSDGVLKYVFDYDFRIGYETGYIDRHIETQELIKKTKALFDGKKTVGVPVFYNMHKAREWVVPPHKSATAAYELGGIKTYGNIISKNSIPSCAENDEYPIAVANEYARNMPLEKLKNGAILDVSAAKILSERGVDTGLISCKLAHGIAEEYYPEFFDSVNNFGDTEFNEIVCSDKAEVLSVLHPSGTPGSYRYENADGIRFIVFASEFFYSPENANYFNNYFRQEQLISEIEWACGNKLPAVSKKHPNLYMLTAKNENSTSVLLVNNFLDDVVRPTVTLDKAYSSIKCVNCTAELKDDKVFLSTIPPYGFAAFEVSE